jgi:hypothetical protein|tara:strand:- start:68 stop:307 length:240 start_codon:yes stop_codon:yes gene_type:complete
MFPQVILAKWFKSYVLPKVLDHMIRVFKLDKVLDYVEKENDADRGLKQLKSLVQAQNDKLVAENIKLKHRIDKLEKPED